MTRALLIIDIRNDYFPGGVLPLEGAEDVEKGVVRAIGLARAAGDRVILVRHQSPNDAGLFAMGSAGAEIRAEILAAAEKAPVVVKQVADAFQDTDLATHLEGVDTLLICGMMTQNCVVFTAMSEMAAGFDVQVLGDLCAAPLDVVHKIALNALGSKLTVTDAQSAW